MAWEYVDFHAGQPKLGWAIAAPPPTPGYKPDENAICPGQSWPEYLIKFHHSKWCAHVTLKCLTANLVTKSTQISW